MHNCNDNTVTVVITVITITLIKVENCQLDIISKRFINTKTNNKNNDNNNDKLQRNKILVILI
jgi:hypothetical protein